MKYYLIQDGLETGPFSIEYINGMHARREITPDTLCRGEDTERARPFGEVFPHLSGLIPDADGGITVPEEFKQRRKPGRLIRQHGLLITLVIPIIFFALYTLSGVLFSRIDSRDTKLILVQTGTLAIVCSSIISVCTGIRHSAEYGAFAGTVIGVLTFIGVTFFYVAVGMAGCAILTSR
jgi:uncharacterized membrane protein HdeD (DUF308 family)